MQKWLYLRLLVYYDDTGKITGAITNRDLVFKQADNASLLDLQNYLDACGTDGWEMVNATRALGMFSIEEAYYFKRPIK